MAKTKACKECKRIVESGDKCPNCGSRELTEGYKGRMIVLNPEKSEIARELNIKEKGSFAIKIK